MREAIIESYLRKQVLLHGGEVRKVKWLDRNGAPDRLVLLGRGVLVELKATDGTVKPHQEREHTRLRTHGMDVRVINSKTQVDELIQELTQ